ncbi:ATP-binding protein [Streptomyces sp. NPDC053541]|uniref:ATP-binding protein n=1 Tax=Streptomyces sp. NPDC053541 TaxID=3365709 RepID=UPI0037CE3EDB
MTGVLGVWAGQTGGVRLLERGGGPQGLVGRETELAAVRGALRAHRLVSVTGAAGVGKSRLALAAVAPAEAPWQAMVRVRWHDGVPAGPRALAGRIAQALDAAGGGYRGTGPAPELGEAVRALPDGELLLILDDVDPVHAQCAGIVQSLLMALPALRVLVTARRPLGLGDEHVVRLAPLATGPAAELLRASAEAHGVPGEPDPAAVARVCRLLEGNPLAIELAAAQLTDLPADALADRLQDGQCWLAATGPLLKRHRSWRASLGAVHALCEPAARKAWRRLSVFAGDFTERAAVFVCEGADLSPDRVPGALAHLTAIGALERGSELGAVLEPRYRMTRAARDFGAERLAAAGESAAARGRHARHCRSTAAVAETLWNTGLQQQAVRLVQDELADLTALVRRGAHDTGHAEIALETVLHLWFWWVAHERAREGAGHVLALLPRLPAADRLTARGQWLAGWLTTGADPATAQRLLDRAWPVAVLSGDDALVGRIAHVHGTLAWQRGELATAAAHYRHAADTVPPLAPGGPTPAVSLAALAIVHSATAPARAVRTARRALAQRTGHHDTWATALAQYARALADLRAGHPGRARRRAERALGHLDARLDAPQPRAALRRLLDTLPEDTGPGAGPAPATPHPPAPASAPVPPPRSGT